MTTTETYGPLVRMDRPDLDRYVREFVSAVSDVTDSIDDSQNYISRESIPADAVIELLRGIRSRLENSVENLIGD